MQNVTTEKRARKTRAFAPNPKVANEKMLRPAVVTVLKDRTEIYRFLRDFRNFPKFSESVLSAEANGEHFTWSLRVASKKEGVDVTITRDEPGKTIEWNVSHADGSSENCNVSLFDGPRAGSSIVSMRLGNDFEKGRIKGVLELLFGNHAKSESVRTLRRLKALLETGEIPTVQGQSSGRESATH